MALLRVLGVVGALLFALQLGWWLPRHAGEQASDAQVYYRATQHMAAGQHVYGDCVRERRDVPPGSFLYPPSALALLRPFAHVSPHAFDVGLLAVLIFAFWLFAAGLAHIAFPQASGTEALLATAAVGAAVQLTGVSVAIAYGNIDVIVWACIAWAFAARRHAGPLLVLAASLKIYPVFLLVAWWRFMTADEKRDTLRTCAAIAGFTLLVVPPQHIVEFFTVCLPELSRGSFVLGNVSVVAWLLRPFVTDMAAPLPHWMTRVFSFTPIVAVGAAMYTFRARGRQTLGAVVIVTAVATSAICWWWRLAFALLIPAALWVRNRKEQASCVTV